MLLDKHYLPCHMQLLTNGVLLLLKEEVSILRLSESHEAKATPLHDHNVRDLTPGRKKPGSKGWSKARASGMEAFAPWTKHDMWVACEGTIVILDP